MKHFDHDNSGDRRDLSDRYVQGHGLVYAFEYRRGAKDKSRCSTAWRPCGLGIRYGMRRSGMAFNPFRWTRPSRRVTMCLHPYPGQDERSDNNYFG